MLVCKFEFKWELECEENWVQGFIMVWNTMNQLWSYGPHFHLKL